MVVVAICLSVLLVVTVAGCSSSDNSNGDPNDGDGMMNNGGSNSSQGSGMMNNGGSSTSTASP
jgi:major membrane immunogen (membrane-anchored lipoprotein)